MARTDSIDYGLCYECNGEGTIRQASGGILNVATVTCEVCGGSGRMGAEEEAAVVARVDLSDIPMPHITVDPDAHAALVARSTEQERRDTLARFGFRGCDFCGQSNADCECFRPRTSRHDDDDHTARMGIF